MWSVLLWRWYKVEEVFAASTFFGCRKIAATSRNPIWLFSTNGSVSPTTLRGDSANRRLCVPFSVSAQRRHRKRLRLVSEWTLQGGLGVLASGRAARLSTSQSKDQMENRASLDFIVCRRFLIVPEKKDGRRQVVEIPKTVVLTLPDTLTHT